MIIYSEDLMLTFSSQTHAFCFYFCSISPHNKPPMHQLIIKNTSVRFKVEPELQVSP